VEPSNSNINSYEYFDSMATLFTLQKKSKIEHLSCIDTSLLDSKKDNRKTNLCKRIRILLDSGCAANLINQSLVDILKVTKEKKTSGIAESRKLVNLLPTESVRQHSNYLLFINIENYFGTSM
jgi:hypothetical protein